LPLLPVKWRFLVSDVEFRLPSLSFGAKSLLAFSVEDIWDFFRSVALSYRYEQTSVAPSMGFRRLGSGALLCTKAAIEHSFILSNGTEQSEHMRW